MAATTEFFKDQTEQSAVKAKIVSDYFVAWARVIKKWNVPMGYVDLFCGPGRYGDNSPSAPVQIIQSTLNDSGLIDKMQFLFNDNDKNNIMSLRKEIASIDEKSLLADRIKFYSETVDSGFHDKIQIPDNMPILSFVDPFGYKGLTIYLIDLLIRNSGSDCIFFFNYNRINMALSSNTKFDEHLNNIFGENQVATLKEHLADLPPEKREPAVLNALIKSLTRNTSNYVLPFKFYGKEQLRTSHFIVFVTKHPVACSIMKQIMYTNSAKDSDGVATFSFEDSRNFDSEFDQLSLFTGPIQELKERLLKSNWGKRMTVKALCDKEDCDFSSHYIGKNVKDALRMLEEEDKIRVLSGRKCKYRSGKLTMPDGAVIEFI